MIIKKHHLELFIRYFTGFSVLSALQNDAVLIALILKGVNRNDSYASLLPKQTDNIISMPLLFIAI